MDAVMVDPLARRVLLRRSLGGSLQRFVPTDDGLLLLLGPRDGGIGAARLVVFSTSGSIRVLRVKGVPAGFEHEELEDGFVVDRYRTPGLAVDPSGRVEGGLLAVSGWDDHASFDAEGNQTQTSTPAGVVLVDTQRWSKRILEADATAASVAGDLLLVYGSRWNSEAGGFEGVGLSGFALTGERRLSAGD